MSGGACRLLAGNSTAIRPQTNRLVHTPINPIEPFCVNRFVFCKNDRIAFFHATRLVIESIHFHRLSEPIDLEQLV